MNGEPGPDEWQETDIEGECRIDMPMKLQLIMDEIEFEGTST